MNKIKASGFTYRLAHSIVKNKHANEFSTTLSLQREKSQPYLGYE